MTMWNRLIETFWKIKPGSPVITNVASDPVAHINLMEADNENAKVGKLEALRRNPQYLPSEEHLPSQSAVISGGGRGKRAAHRKRSSRRNHKKHRARRVNPKSTASPIAAASTTSAAPKTHKKGRAPAPASATARRREQPGRDQKWWMRVRAT